jgi:LuxR family transcriptional regulator, maltose regulon positive regulatory protein
MGVADVREPPALKHAADGAPFDLVVSKLCPPPVRPGTIGRSGLLERLAGEQTRRIVSVVAPPGYGKTTLLAQWAQRAEPAGPAFAWVSVDERDNDPKVLLAYMARALDAVQPVGGRVFDALASSASSVPGSVVPRLGAALAGMTVPVVLVVDDVHLLRNRECQDALSLLAEHVPAGSRLVLAGRSEPPLRVARLRAEGRILEIGPADLALTGEEAAALLREAGLVLDAGQVAVVHRRTEGWPAGLYLAALYLREGGAVGTAAVSFGGDDRLVSQYMESELLARISHRHRVFVTRTAVLERMSGGLCQAVLDQPEAIAVLAELARSNLLLVPLDRRGVWYRYHHLFRDMLLAELERLEPGLLPVLRRRAAAWCLDNDLPEEALEYSMAAGDVETAARLVETLYVPADRHSRVTTVQRWFRWLDDRRGIEGHPMLVVFASRVAAETGRPAEAERWADLVDSWRDGDVPHREDPHTEAWAAVLRAIMCRRGAKQMRADADEAARRVAETNLAAPIATVLQGMARILGGDLERADAFFEDAASASEQISVATFETVALCERALLAMARGDWDRAEALAGRAGAVFGRAGMAEIPGSPLVCAVQARAALHRGDVKAARQQLARAQRQRPLLTYSYPQFAVQVRLELIRVHLGLGDVAGARTLMREIDEILRRRPDLGTLVGEARAARARLSAERSPGAAGASPLTGAELRVLPMLATHMSFPEIGAEMFLSPNTVKSQAMSIYRKLGASSRHQAVTQSREMGLLEG